MTMVSAAETSAVALIQLGTVRGTNDTNGLINSPSCLCDLAQASGPQGWEMGVTVQVVDGRHILGNWALVVALHLTGLDFSRQTDDGAEIERALVAVVERFGPARLRELGRRHRENNAAVVCDAITPAQWRKTHRELFGSVKRGDQVVMAKMRFFDHLRTHLHAACVEHSVIPAPRAAARVLAVA